VSGGADRAIRVSTAAAVIGVAGIAAYVSYQHAFEVVRAHGESGLTVRLEPATIDGLVYSSSMVILYAARHRLPVPALARWLLALGIVATLAANVAHGWPDGPVGAVVAAWPAASLVGSYELLLWLIRTSAAMTRSQNPGQDGDLAVHTATDLQLLPVTATGADGSGSVLGDSEATGAPDDRCTAAGAALDRIIVPCRPGPDGAHQPADQQEANRSAPDPPVRTGGGEYEVDTAAVAAYRASLESGTPLSERKLAAMFGKTSRRWARSRMAEARHAVAGAS
jgi:Protein of unknown function (DUF2637)